MDFNLIMSNGARSSQRARKKEYFTHMMPEGVPNTVDINHTGMIKGFSFFDKDRKEIWRIRNIECPGLKVQKVEWKMRSS